jgi:hypothetical protein
MEAWSNISRLASRASTYLEWKIFWLTAVPLPHASYVFIYVAFTTDLLQIF